MATADASSSLPGDIRRLEVPTRLAVGSVNGYLLLGEPLTLVDGGPPEALKSLEVALADAGVDIGDLELIIVTHQHIDHVGLAGTLAQRSGASVACLRSLVGYVRDLSAAREEDAAVAQQLMAAHGVPAAAALPVLRRMRDRARDAAGVVVDHPLDHGTRIVAGGRRLTALHRPGHSPSDTVLHDEADRIAIAGDHLLPAISSNAMLARDPGRRWNGARPRPLVAYRASLVATAAMDLRLVLPGHGEPITRHRPLIDDRLQSQDSRAQRLLGLLDAAGPSTAYELARGLWGDVADEQAFLTLSEVIGHLDLLIDAGLVVEDEERAPHRFRRV